MTTTDPVPFSPAQYHPMAVSGFTPPSKFDMNMVEWRAFPMSEVSPSFPWMHYNVNDNSVTEYSGSTTIPDATIFTRSFNSTTGAYDLGTFPVAFGTPIIITSGTAQPALYTDLPLTGTYSGSEAFTQVEWSVDPDENPGYTVTFQPNPSDVTGQPGNLTTNTTMKVTGPNEPVTVKVYACALGADMTDPVRGVTNHPITFDAAPSAPQGTVLTVVSLDNHLLGEAASHLLEATYTNLDGTPVTDPNWTGTITWTVDPLVAGVKLLDPDPTKATNGVAINAVSATYGPDKITATIKAHATNMADNAGNSSSIDLTFVPEVQPVAGQGHMTIIPKDGYVLTRSVPHDLTVFYNNNVGTPVPDGTEVIWKAFPDQTVNFQGGGKSITMNGQATMTVTVPVDAPIGQALVSTATFNPQTGSYDHPDFPLGLDFISPVTAIM
ncbi:hypothetical protein, partial [Brucella endophytica]